MSKIPEHMSDQRVVPSIITSSIYSVFHRTHSQTQIVMDTGLEEIHKLVVSLKLAHYSSLCTLHFIMILTLTTIINWRN